MADHKDTGDRKSVLTQGPPLAILGTATEPASEHEGPTRAPWGGGPREDWSADRARGGAARCVAGPPAPLPPTARLTTEPGDTWPAQEGGFLMRPV